MRLAVVTEDWPFQHAGRCPLQDGLLQTLPTLRSTGHTIDVINPKRLGHDATGSMALRVVGSAKTQLDKLLQHPAMNALLIATEGPLGWAARQWARQHDRPFASVTTAGHATHPCWPSRPYWLPEGWLVTWLNRFHAAASTVLTATRADAQALQGRGFHNLKVWHPGVDLQAYTPHGDRLASPGRLVFLWVLASQQGQAFAPTTQDATQRAADQDAENLLAQVSRCGLPGALWLAAEGPLPAGLREAYPQVRMFDQISSWSPALRASLYRSADVLLLPDRLEGHAPTCLQALACGTPIAGLATQSRSDLLGHSQAGVLGDDVLLSGLQALQIPRGQARHLAEKHGQTEAAERLLSLLPVWGGDPNHRDQPESTVSA